jgi:hypothetical protein
MIEAAGLEPCNKDMRKYKKKLQHLVHFQQIGFVTVRTKIPSKTIA